MKSTLFTELCVLGVELVYSFTIDILGYKRADSKSAFEIKQALHVEVFN